jgi:hypothetical protein
MVAPQLQAVETEAVGPALHLRLGQQAPTELAAVAVVV